MSPEMRQLFAIVCAAQGQWANRLEDEALTLAKFHGPSSPQLHIEYRIGRPVAMSARDMLLKRSKEMSGVPERPSLKQLSYSVRAVT